MGEWGSREGLLEMVGLLDELEQLSRRRREFGL